MSLDLFNHTFYEAAEDLSGESAWIGHIPFAIWLMDFLKPRIVVELGTHCGDSYFAFCQGAKKFSSGTKLYAVDTWEGDPHAGFYSEEIYERVAKINASKYDTFSVLLRKTFDEALGDFEDRSINLLHIDGMHTYDAVKHDFESWYPKLAQNSVVLFHDTCVRRDDFGVYRFWEEVCGKYPSVNFLHCNGLGVLISGWADDPAVVRLAQAFRSHDNSQEFVRFFGKLGRVLEYSQKEEQIDGIVAYSHHLESDISELNEYTTHVEKDFSELKAYVTHVEKDASELKAYVTHVEKDVSELRASLTNAEQSLAEAEKKEVELKREMADLGAENVRLLETERQTRHMLNLTETELIRLKDELHRIYTSKTWRYSAVLRKIRHFFSVETYMRLNARVRKSVFGRFLYRLLSYRDKIKAKWVSLPYSKANTLILQQMVGRRSSFLLNANTPGDESDVRMPEIDLTAVVYNNAGWLESFLSSLLRQKYPTASINLFLVDNGSTDSSLMVMSRLQQLHENHFKTFTLIKNENIGFGAGHDTGIRSGAARFVLVSNIDIEFEPDAISTAVRCAAADHDSVASWEFRQIPYEHPKFYDPVTLDVTWSSHACILIRRTAYEAVGGYDKHIFMYGEDVELSYRFRDKGYRIRYIPSAVVHHYTYAEANEVKPVQFKGSLLANALIRFRYGSFRDKLIVFPIQFFLMLRGAGFKGSRMLVLKNQWVLLNKIRFFWKNRPENEAFPFYNFDYEKVRYGSFYKIGKPPVNPPLVTVITRTYKGRDRLLLECMSSVLNQTYSPIEHIIVEDGGHTMKPLIDKVKAKYPNHNIVYQGLPKKGRSFAGNRGLEMARGKFCLFLDDDDLIFADHVEVLASTLLQHKQIDAAYALAWEVETSFAETGDYREHMHRTDSVFYQEFDSDALLHHNYIPIQAILFKKELYDSYGGFDEEMEILEDWNLWTKYALNADFKFVPKTTSLYRTPYDMKTRLSRKKILDEAYQEAIKKQRQLLVRYGNQ